MKQTVTNYDFVNAFDSCGRKDQFSRSGQFALFEYLEELESDTGTELELDVIAICCDYSEYANAREAALEYDWEDSADSTDEENEESALKYLHDNTQVIEHDEGIIIANY